MNTKKVIKPRTDRRQLQQIIAGLSEGVLLIDPDGTIVWANEAALEMHGCERLEQIGTDAVQYRRRFALRYLNHHVLTARQYPVARVIAGERFDGVTVEVTRRDAGDFRRVHQVSSLLLTDSRAIEESLVLVIRDVSELLSAEERFERTFAANPAPALICRLSDSRYIKVNQGFLEMTGYERDAVIDCRLCDLDILARAEHREEANRCFREGITITQQEAVLRLAGGKNKCVIVAGQPIEVGDAACMLFTFNDLDARKQAETLLKQSEQRFSKAFRLAPVPMMLCTLPELRVLEVNDAFGMVTGHDTATVTNKLTAEIGLWKTAQSYRGLRDALEAQRKVSDAEIEMCTRAGAVIDCLLSAEPVMIQGEPCALFVVQDITERKRSEMDLIAAIEAVMNDASWFSHSVMEKLAQIRHAGVRDSTAGELAMLTPREREVLGLMCEGYGDTEIATALKLSRNTVRNHVSSLYGKIGVNRRSAAVVWGRERGVIGY